MELNDLRIFKTVAERGSVSQAAVELSYVQSNVTARIKQLEKDLKTMLFTRHKRGMILNAEGKRLLIYAEEILAKFDEMKRTFQSADAPSGILNIGIVETMISLPGILSNYVEKYPNVDFSLNVGVSEQLLQDVMNFKLDGAFVTGPINHPLIEASEIFREELILVTKSSSFTIEDVTNTPLLLFNKGCSYRERLEGWLREEGIVPRKIMQFGTFETIIGSVTAGIGITISPKSSVSHLIDEGKVHAYPVSQTYNEVSTVFIHRKDSFLTSTLRSFIDELMLSADRKTNGSNVKGSEWGRK
ncbi:LysR family transcriptional regulator [Paenibacillus sp. FSL K6-2862]|uniref:LysR family transcriptional regulator n=1 Tax=Paenibacillus sp. FSL K6-2862 TaxID=2921484 RepID=UPI0030F7D138